jgi:hypothetical protein
MQLRFRGLALLGFEFGKDEAALFMGHDNVKEARRACCDVTTCPGHRGLGMMQ